MARIADRFNRRTIMAIMLATWSIFTVACGLAQTFLQMALARFGVGSGEAGIVPTSLSIISDYYPAHQRGTATAVFTAAIPIGVLVGFPMAGWLNDIIGWRWTFIVVGLPGVFLALSIRLLLIEPPRGHADKLAVDNPPPPLRDVAKYLWHCKSYRNLVLGGAATGFGYASVIQWTPSFLVRSFGMDTSEVGNWLALSIGLVGGTSTILSGWLADLLGKKDPRWYAWMPCAAMIALIPLGSLVYLTQTKIYALIFLALPMALYPIYLGPLSAMVQGLASVRMRATAAAISILTANLLGLALGPLIVGIISDMLSPKLGPEALRYAILSVVVFGAVWGSIHWFAGSRTLREDLAANKP